MTYTENWRTDPASPKVNVLIKLVNFLLLSLCLTISSIASEAEPARILNISPSQGPIAGGDIVTLTGFGFTGTSLTLDGMDVTPISASNTQITFQTPPHENGIASVKLSGNGPNAYAEFLYLPPPLRSLAPGQITTIMGGGHFRGDGRKATNAVLETVPIDMAIDADGTLYFSEPNHNYIRRVRTDGVIERYAGIGDVAFGGDGGQAIEAQLAHPRGLAFDPAGNLLVADSVLVNCIRKIDRQTGIISTIVGGQTAGYSGDGGPASQAQLDHPIKIAFDGAGNLYILEGGGAAGGSFVCNHPRIRKVDTKGGITTIAGTGEVGFSGDGGPALNASFNIGVADAGGLAADAAGNVYVADSGNRRVRKIDAQTGIITTIYASQFDVMSVTTDGSGNVYVGSNSNSSQVLKITSSGQILQRWGQDWNFSEDGADAGSASLCAATGIGLDINSNILFAESCSNRIRRINRTTGILETVAGMGPHIIGETGPALATTLSGSIGTGLLFLPTGELLTAEAANYLVRKLDLEGNVSVFAGSGFLSFRGPSNGSAARQSSILPVELARAPNGDILIVGGPWGGLLRIDGQGILHTVAGFPPGYMDSPPGFSGDGALASLAQLDEPYDVAADSAGNVYIADTNNNRIRRIDAQTGIISSVAGSGPVNGYENYGAGSYCGDGGLATEACINTPVGIAVTSDGTMYIGENAERVRKVDANGTITTLFSGGGTQVRLGPGGNLFTVPFRIEPNGHAFRFASWNPTAWTDCGIAIDAEGNLFYAAGTRILAVRFGAVIAEPGSTVAATAGTPQTASAETAFPVALQVTVMSPADTPENGIRVDFAAPTSGASCRFPNGSYTYSTLTDISGHASVTCIANNQQGKYSVSAAPLNLNSTVEFVLTNVSPAENSLWLNHNRFVVEVDWSTLSGASGKGTAVPLTSDSGYFWFFDSSNVELMVKILDGCTVNGHFWVFYGAMTDVQYTITVTDTAMGVVKTYQGQQGIQQSGNDINAFTDSAAAFRSPALDPVREAKAFEAALQALESSSNTALAGGSELHLNGNRFTVQINWSTLSGSSGQGTAVPLTSDSGYFWFFGDTNVEVLVKILDGRGTNGHFWFFWGAMTDVRYTITVTDTVTGTARTYDGQQGVQRSGNDTMAF